MKQLIVLAALLAAAACGGKAGAPATTTTGVPADEPMTPARWEGMDLEARAGYMKRVVLPTMTAVLKEHPELFGDREITCATCHGSGAELGEFDMPNPELPVLTMEAIQHPDDDHKAVVAFMAERVTPEMAQLLGRETWRPDAPDGFGCGGCHTFAQ
jgi:hypothetical protein